jgi:hypothetical protein
MSTFTKSGVMDQLPFLNDNIIVNIDSNTLYPNILVINNPLILQHRRNRNLYTTKKLVDRWFIIIPVRINV